MSGCRQSLSLSLIAILAVSSLMMVESASAQSIPKPSVPEFTLEYVEHPYDVPPTYGIDQYTGKTIVTQAGYHVENKSVEISIRNQENSVLYNNTVYGFYLDVRVKGHFGTDWKWIFSPDGSRNNRQGQADGQYTIFSYTISPHYGSKLDFQVERSMGHLEKVWVPLHPLYPDYGSYEEEVFKIDETSWSNIQTISIPDGSVSVSTSPTPNPTPTPSVPEFSWFMILPLFIFTLSITAIVRLKNTWRITQN